MSEQSRQIDAAMAARRAQITAADAAIERAKSMLYHDEFKWGGELRRAQGAKAQAQRELIALEQSRSVDDATATRGHSSQVFIGGQS